MFDGIYQRGPSGTRHQLEDVAVGIPEVDAPAAVPGIELLILKIPRVAAVRESGLLHPLENGVELRVAHMKRVVMDVEMVVIVEIEGQSLIDAHRSKVSTRPLVLQSKDIREKAGRGRFVASRHDGVIQDDRHGSFLSRSFGRRKRSSRGFLSHDPRDFAQRLSYSSWRRNQAPVSLRPLGARSSHWYMPQRPSSPRV